MVIQEEDISLFSSKTGIEEGKSDETCKDNCDAIIQLTLENDRPKEIHTCKTAFTEIGRNMEFAVKQACLLLIIWKGF